jgi:hypothetical protein
MPPVRGNGLAVAEALALMISSPIALDMELLIMSSIMCCFSIIWSSSSYATAAGAHASAANKANRPTERIYSCFSLLT